MFESFWREYIDTKIAEQYYLQYIHHSKRWQIRINAFCMIVSFSGVVAWINETLNPFVSGLIILISQIISVLQPLYPHGDRLYAANCIYNEIKPLALSAEQTVNRYLYGSLSEDAIPSELERLQTSISTVEGKYSNADLFPHKMRLHKKAQNDVEQYLRIHFDLGGRKYG